MHRILLAGIGALAAALLVAAPALAAGYATDDAGYLYEVIPDEKSIAKIGVVRVTTTAKDGTSSTTQPTLTDLALSDLHGLYGISFSDLYRIDFRDPSKSQRVGPLKKNGYGQFNALAFDDKGRLFALEYGTLYQINLKTGLATRLADLGRWSSDGDLAWVGDALYATVNGGGGIACHLIRIDMKTWKTTDIGRIRQTAAVTTGGKAKPETGAGSKAGDAGSSTDTPRKEAPKKAPKKASERKGRKGRKPTLLRSFDDVWGLIWDGRDLYGVTPQGELIQISYRDARAVVVMRVRATFYGSCAMLRI